MATTEDQLMMECINGVVTKCMVTYVETNVTTDEMVDTLLQGCHSNVAAIIGIKDTVNTLIERQ